MAPPQPERANPFSDGKYSGNDRVEVEIARLNYTLPPFYPPEPLHDFEFKKCDSNRYLSGAAVGAYEKKWTNLRGHDILPVRIEMGAFDSHSAQAAYLGFQGKEGLNNYTYFLDNPAADIFGPLRRYLDDKPRFKVSIVGFMSHVYCVRECRWDKWVKQILKHKEIFSVPEGAKADAKNIRYWAILAAVLRGLKRFPRLLVETDKNTPEDKRLTPHVRGHSMEDYSRLFTVYREFFKRRNDKKYSSKSVPANNFVATTLVWYRTPEELKAAAATGDPAVCGTSDSTPNNPQIAGYDVLGAHWSLEMEKLRRQLNTGPVSAKLHDEAFKRYMNLEGEKQREFAYDHLDALEELRVQMYRNPECNAVGKSLPPITPEETDALMEVLQSRIEKLTEGKDFKDNRGRLDDPEFVKLVIDTIDRANNIEVNDFDESDDNQERGAIRARGTDDEQDEDEDEGDALRTSKKSFHKGKRQAKRTNGDEIINRSRRAGVRPQRLSDLLDASPKAYTFIKTESERHQNDFINIIDELFGGNNTGGMTMKAAKSLTGFDWENPILDSADPDSARLLPHQIPDVAAIVDKLRFFPHSALLSSACGIGKAFEALATIYVTGQKAMKERKKQDDSRTPRDKKDRRKFYPSLWLCPSTLVRAAYDECVSKFQGLLTPKIYYGAQADFTDDPTADVISDHSQWMESLSNLDPDNPESAKVVYISSYFTFKRRSMVCTTKPRKALSDEDRMHLGFHLYDSPGKRQQPAEAVGDSSDDSDDQPIVPSRQNPMANPDPDDEDEEEDEEDEDTLTAKRQLRQQYDDELTEPVPEDQLEDEQEEMQRLAPRNLAKEKKAKKNKRAQQTYKLYAPLFNQRFNVVVCDEAHILKNKATASHKTVKALKRDHLLHVTATPMLNQPRDITAYLLMMWPRCHPSPVPAAFSYRTMYGTGSKLQLLDPYRDVRETGYLKRSRGALPHALHMAHQGRRPFNKHHKLLQPFIVEPQANISDPCAILDKTDPLFDNLDYGWRKQRRPVWLLNPCNFFWASREFGFEFEACREMIRPMLPLICVKRGLQTLLKLPDGRKTRPADAIPGAHFRVVDLQFKPPEQREYDSIWCEWKPVLFSVETKADRKQDKPRDRDLHERPGSSTKSSGGLINMKAFRRLSLPAFCLDNEKLLQPRENTAGIATTVGISREHQERMAALNKSVSTKGGKQVRSAPMGTEEVQSLASNTKDGGASWLWSALNPNVSRHSPPNSRYQFVRFLCWNSPILCATIIQIQKWMKERNEFGLPNKVVIMSQMPWAQQDVTLVLQMMGWNVLSIRSDHPVPERSRIIAKFNDPKNASQILSTSMDLSAYGLNMHPSCCKGIVTQWCWSANQLIQILGRLTRIGQKRSVEWVIYNMPGTMYHRMQTTIFSKYVHQLAVEAKIPKTVRGYAATLAGYSLIQKLFNMPHHLALCDRSILDLDTCWLDELDRTQRTAKFFGMVGEKLLAEAQPDPKQEKVDWQAYTDLMERGIADFIAGAYVWQVANDGGRTPALTWRWLDDACRYSRLSQLTPSQKFRYIHPDIEDQLTKIGKENLGITANVRPNRRPQRVGTLASCDGGANKDRAPTNELEEPAPSNTRKRKALDDKPLLDPLSSSISLVHSFHTAELDPHNDLDALDSSPSDMGRPHKKKKTDGTDSSKKRHCGAVDLDDHGDGEPKTNRRRHK
ncbi:hypothetical protein HD806DRAFT_516838 [Xylariaceae sp. AK1471]|nr:hypothetical protein HD806DRAFT_516838 [Xylariaceae sp. AK1471]